MVLFLSLGKIFALYIELNTDLGMKPLFSKENCRGETVLNFPCGQIVYTPRSVLIENRRRCLTHTEYVHETGNTTFHKAVAGIAEN